MNRGGRKLFFLMYTSPPDAADIVREDFLILDGRHVLDLKVGERVTFKWLESKIGKHDKYTPIEGQILLTGLKVQLQKAKVGANGVILNADSTEDPLKTRKQELAAIRYQQLHANEDVLQAEAEELQEKGPSAPVSRLPKDRSSEARQALQGLIDRLPCFVQSPHKWELLRGKGVWMDNGKMGVMRQEYRMRPKEHFRKIMKHLLSPILKLDGISTTGKRGCLGIPAVIPETVNLYVMQIYRQGGGDEKLHFSVSAIIKNLFDNAKKERRRSASSTCSSSSSATSSLPSSTPSLSVTPTSSTPFLDSVSVPSTISTICSAPLSTLTTTSHFSAPSTSFFAAPSTSSFAAPSNSSFTAFPTSPLSSSSIVPFLPSHSPSHSPNFGAHRSDHAYHSEPEQDLLDISNNRVAMEVEIHQSDY